jgi:hypothetical protein
MRTFALTVAIGACLSACQARAPVLGEHAFAVAMAGRWTEAEARSCKAANGDDLYLFSNGQASYLITHYGPYDVAYLQFDGHEIQTVEANGGLGRYADLERSVRSMRALTAMRLRRNQFGEYLKTEPERSCGF